MSNSIADNDLAQVIRPAFVGWHPLGLATPGAPDGCQPTKVDCGIANADCGSNTLSCVWQQLTKRSPGSRQTCVCWRLSGGALRVNVFPESEEHGPRVCEVNQHFKPPVTVKLAVAEPRIEVGCDEDSMQKARRLPSLMLELATFHIPFTTPYILIESTIKDWTEYLRRTMAKVAGRDNRERLHQLMKFGITTRHWNEFVFQGYHHHQAAAIFLAGIPDLKATLPHA